MALSLLPYNQPHAITSHFPTVPLYITIPIYSLSIIEKSVSLFLFLSLKKKRVLSKADSEAAKHSLLTVYSFLSCHLGFFGFSFFLLLFCFWLRKEKERQKGSRKGKEKWAEFHVVRRKMLREDSGLLKKITNSRPTLPSMALVTGALSQRMLVSLSLSRTSSHYFFLVLPIYRGDSNLWHSGWEYNLSQLRIQFKPVELCRFFSHYFSHWLMLQWHSGLQRCGKSCRLRWTNYLRPDLKHGQFSDMEEQTIVKLHSVVGNRYTTTFLTSTLLVNHQNEFVCMTFLEIKGSISTLQVVADCSSVTRPHWQWCQEPLEH